MIPPTSIVAPVDFSESSRLALVLAARLAHRCGARLLVFHAQDPLLSAAARVEGIALEEETRVELARFVRSAPPAGDIATIHEVVIGQAAPAIAEMAHANAIDLIVMGVRGMSGVERALFGSTTRGVLQRSDVPVLAVPDTWTPFGADGTTPAGLGPVIIGVDFSKESLSAAEDACRLAALLAAPLELWHVVPAVRALPRWRMYSEAAERERESSATRALAALVSHLPYETHIETHVTTGHVAERLAELAAPVGPRRPLVVLGRRAGGDKNTAPGETAARLLAQSSAPILILVPRPQPSR